MLAIFAGLVSLGANLSLNVPDRPEWMGYWNGTVSGGTCLVLALTVSALRKSIQEREVMTQIISHDLKNVLTAMGVNLEFLTMNASPDDPRWKYLDAANGAVARMGRMVGDLTLLVDGNPQSLKLMHTPIDLARLVSDSIELYRPTAAQKNITINAAGLDTPAPAMIDSERIAEVLDNLLGNALKFTPVGGAITLALTCKNKVHEITLEDSGPGIPPSQREHVFEPFWKGSKAAAGSGLGLFISRRIIELHGGQMWFDGPAPGTVTHVRLPAES